jgi:hypothetical protein
MNANNHVQHGLLFLLRPHRIIMSLIARRDRDVPKLNPFAYRPGDIRNV